MTINNNDIAIVGMSCNFPGADNVREFWNNLCNGVSSIIDTPKDRIPPSFFTKGETGIDRFYCKKGGFTNPVTLNPLDYNILPVAVEGIDPEHLIALYLTKEALNDAGVYEKNIPLQNCCFILGKGNYTSIAMARIGEMMMIGDWVQNIVTNIFPEASGDKVDQLKKDFQSQIGRYQADTAAGAMPNMVVSLVANKFNLRGPAYTVDAACASSLLAVEQACNLLLSGQCDMALTGGIHLGHGANFWSVFNVIKAVSGKEKIAPFSEDADGVIIGEGAGIVVLKKIDKAIADNDRIYAVIKACGSGSDGSDVSIMAPSTKGQVETLEKTWRKTDMDPAKIGYVETHGTATQAGDRTEMATLTGFFGDKTAAPALLGSVKSNIGHAMPAAGIAGLIKTALALYHKKIPPTLNCEKPLKAMYDSRFMPAQQLTDWNEQKYPLVAAINAFGFGGINTHAILQAYSAPVKTEDADLPNQSKPDGNRKPKSKMSVTLHFSKKEYDFTLLRKVWKELEETANPGKSGAAIALPLTPVFTDGEIDDPILESVSKNLREIAILQEKMINWHKTKVNKRGIQKTSNQNRQGTIATLPSKRAGSSIEKTIRFDLNEHPYLLDHAVVRQAEHHPLELQSPVVPFAMTLETLGEQTLALAPNKKLLQVNTAGVLKWISVKQPFAEKMTGSWKTDDCISWNLPGYAFGDFTVGDSFPAAPKEYETPFDLGDNVLPATPTKKQIYQFFLFHGPKYQSVIEVSTLTKKGLRATIGKSEGKGSLMDNLGGLLGVWCHLALKENQTTFPMNVDQITFYQDFRDQTGIFEYNLIIKEVTEHEAISKVIIKRNGKVWCVVDGWHNRRFDYPQDTMNVLIRPKQFTVAKRLNDNVFYYYKDPNSKISINDFLYERFLNVKERKHYNSLYANQARDYLISRIALKDGVRKFLQKTESEEMLFPVDITVEHNEQGKPCLHGHNKLKGLEVSIAHKGSEAVVMVSNKPVGIDIEKIEERDKNFSDVSFTAHELGLLKEKGNTPEWITRFWVAKEAYGKMLGAGLQGNPRQYEVESVNGEELKIKDTPIKTILHRDHFIVGWTISK
jgi:3-oxoacyl-(acyl-carrier-protein) synthase/phosphopantetheinyl transferase